MKEINISRSKHFTDCVRMLERLLEMRRSACKLVFQMSSPKASATIAEHSGFTLPHLHS